MAAKWQLLEKLRRKIIAAAAPSVANGWNDPRLKVIDLNGWCRPRGQHLHQLEPRTERW